MTIQKTLLNGKVQVAFIFSKNEQEMDDMYFKGRYSNYHTNNINFLNQ